MISESKHPTARVASRSVERTPDYLLEGLGLPVADTSVVQTEPEQPRYGFVVAAVGEVGLVRARHERRSFGVTVLRPTRTCCALPISWQGVCGVNGDEASPGVVHMPGDGDSIYINGGRRETLGVTLPRDQFIETIAALRGVGPEEVTVQDRVLALTPVARSALLRRLSAILDSVADPVANSTSFNRPRQPFRTVRSAFLALCAAAFAGCASHTYELMPAPAMFHLPASRAIFDEVPQERRRSTIDLLYATDRAPNLDSQADLPYGQSRSRSLAFGSAKVSFVPRMGWQALTRHSLDDTRDVRIALELDAVRELERYPNEPYSLVRVSPRGLRRDPAVLARHDRAEARLQEEVQRRLEAAPSGQVMLYVHGFNETFATAAHTAAELCHFLGRAHVCAFFTWPASASGNPLFSFARTTESAQYSVGHLKKLIRTIARSPGVEGVQLLAHSRGAALLLSAFRELSIEAVAAGRAPVEAYKIENLIFMSPDIDAEVATQQIIVFASDPGITSLWSGPDLPRFLRGRLTIYASPTDRALGLSRLLFRSVERVGQLTPDKVSPPMRDLFEKLGNVDIIVFEGKHTDFFGHTYFLSNPEVSADLIELVRNGTPPGTPRRPLIREDDFAWVFP